MTSSSPTGLRFFLFLSALVYAHAILHRVFVVFRHGDRTPSYLLPADTATWPLGLSQLTPLGVQQQYDLGLSFRKRYVDTGFITGYNRSEVYVRSTDIDRTLQSAQAQLAGWFATAQRDAGTWYPIPIHTVPQQLDSLLLAYDDGMCARYESLRQQYRSSDDWQQFEKDTTDLLKMATKFANGDGVAVHSGYKVSPFVLAPLKIETIYAVTDPLIADMSHQFPWPAGFTPELADRLFRVSDFAMSRMYITREMQKLSAGVLVREMVERMHTAVQPRPKPTSLWPHLTAHTHTHGTDAEIASAVTDAARASLQAASRYDAHAHKLVLYSSHDTTVAALLAALGVSDLKQPPYNSHVVVELHSRDGTAAESTEDFYVRIMFNGVWKTMPGCAENCSLPEFIRQTSDLFLDDDEWRKACVSNSCGSDGCSDTGGRSLSTSTTVLVVLGGIALVIAVSALCVAGARRIPCPGTRRHSPLRDHERSSSRGDISAATHGSGGLPSNGNAGGHSATGAELRLDGDEEDLDFFHHDYEEQGRILNENIELDLEHEMQLLAGTHNEPT